MKIQQSPKLQLQRIAINRHHKLKGLYFRSNVKSPELPIKNSLFKVITCIMRHLHIFNFPPLIETTKYTKYTEKALRAGLHVDRNHEIRENKKTACRI